MEFSEARKGEREDIESERSQPEGFVPPIRIIAVGLWICYRPHLTLTNGRLL
jgi:hypothetical protein